MEDFGGELHVLEEERRGEVVDAREIDEHDGDAAEAVHVAEESGVDVVEDVSGEVTTKEAPHCRRELLATPGDAWPQDRQRKKGKRFAQCEKKKGWGQQEKKMTMENEIRGRRRRVPNPVGFLRVGKSAWSWYGTSSSCALLPLNIPKNPLLCAFNSTLCFRLTLRSC